MFGEEDLGLAHTRLRHLLELEALGPAELRDHGCAYRIIVAALVNVAALADDGATMQNLKLTTVGAYCGILTFASFLLGIVFMATSGVQVLIPDTGGHKTLDWIADVNDASSLFFAGAWLVILGGIFAFVAILGFYEALRDAGPVMILAPVLAVVGMTLVTISHTSSRSPWPTNSCRATPTRAAPRRRRSGSLRTPSLRSLTSSTMRATRSFGRSSSRSSPSQS
jgi:hypothetical protein